MGDEELARRLRDAVRGLLVAHQAFDEARRPCGVPLSMPHAHALLELRWYEPTRDAEAMTVGALAARLRIDRTNVSRLCARMEAQGHLIRAPHPTDGRARVLTLTPQGVALADEVDAASTERFGVVLRALGTGAPGASEEVCAALEALTRAMGSHVQEAL